MDLSQKLNNFFFPFLFSVPTVHHLVSTLHPSYSYQYVPTVRCELYNSWSASQCLASKIVTTGENTAEEHTTRDCYEWTVIGKWLVCFCGILRQIGSSQQNNAQNTVLNPGNLDFCLLLKRVTWKSVAINISYKRKSTFILCR